jgi:flavin reductase (DIM6/NTAB) family NADH-FMN oxidoreductase RutF
VLHGTTANALTSVSLDPPLLLICLAHTSRTLAALRMSRAFGVNLLGAEAEDVARAFARSGASEAWDGVEHAAGPSGSPLFARAHAAIECEVDDVHTAGDHDIVLGRVLHVVVEEDGGAALLWFRSAFGATGDPRVPTPSH